MEDRLGKSSGIQNVVAERLHAIITMLEDNSEVERRQFTQLLLKEKKNRITTCMDMSTIDVAVLRAMSLSTDVILGRGLQKMVVKLNTNQRSGDPHCPRSKESQ